VPLDEASIVLLRVPVRDCVLDQNRIVGNIVNTQSTYKFIINGKQLNLQEIFIYQMVVRSMQQLPVQQWYLRVMIHKLSQKALCKQYRS
jgi:hypothetical protein